MIWVFFIKPDLDSVALSVRYDIGGNAVWDRQINTIKKFQIYNRWGDVMHEAFDFSPNDPSKGWDGQFRNEKINPGVFTYIAEIQFIDGIVGVYMGDVTVVK